jgi:DNA invertase Pin-like site-specific DNA recombinase
MRRHHRTAEGQWYTETSLPRPWERWAVVDVRQSTMPHVLEPQASTRWPDGLVRRAVAWGWPAARVLVSDDALGRSGPSAAGRQGLQRLVAAVGLEHVGLILGGEMARVARSSKAWHPLLESCALVGPLLADLAGR